MAHDSPFLPARHDATSPLRHADDLSTAAEPAVRAAVDASLEQHGPFALYGIAWQLGSVIVRETQTLLAWVVQSPHTEVHKLLYEFLCALLSETWGNMAVAWSSETFKTIMRAGEWTARKVVCSLMWLQRAVRCGLPFEAAS